MQDGVLSLHWVGEGPTWYGSQIEMVLININFKGWPQVLGRIGIVALVASLDIGNIWTLIGKFFHFLPSGLSQWSFEYIDVALYTVTKSTSIVFILMFAILFRLEKKHWSLIIIVLMISTGLAMFTYKSTDFVFIGFTMVLSASFLSGLCLYILSRFA